MHKFASEDSIEVEKYLKRPDLNYGKDFNYIYLNGIRK